MTAMKQGARKSAGRKIPCKKLPSKPARRSTQATGDKNKSYRDQLANVVLRKMRTVRKLIAELQDCKNHNLRLSLQLVQLMHSKRSSSSQTCLKGTEEIKH